MSTFTTLPIDVKDLRPLLHRRLDDATDEELAAVHRMLQEMEARRLVDELSAATDQAWSRGQITEEKTEEAIHEHRQGHHHFDMLTGSGCKPQPIIPTEFIAKCL